MKPSLAILKAAREWLNDPKHWTKGAYSKDKKGLIVMPAHQPTVASTCAMGAIQRAGGGMNWQAQDKALGTLRIVIGQPELGIAGWNDNRKTKHADVLAAFDKAIELEKADVL